VNLLCRLTVFVFILLSFSFAFGQSKSKPSDKFRQLSEDELPTPNEQRAASGAPGNRYWQNRADYSIDVELDDQNQRISGKETVTYKNVSPDTLDYVWLQLDQNIHARDSDSTITRAAPDFTNGLQISAIEQLAARTYDGKVNITSVTDSKNANLRYSIVKTMMRIE
jgi:hypothetical protein